jgi:hypothetical protein
VTAPRTSPDGIPAPLTPDQTAALDQFASWCLHRAADQRRRRADRTRAAAAADLTRTYLKERTR